MPGILILAEQVKGELSEITFEMLGAGRKMAQELKVPLYAMLLGSNVSGLASSMGVADKVFVVDDPQLTMPSADTMCTLVTGLMEREKVSLVLVGGTNVAMGVGSMLSARANLPYVNFCRNVRVDGGALVLTSQIFGGKIFSDVRLAQPAGIICIYPGAFPADAGRSDKAATVEKAALQVPASKVVFRKFIEPKAGDVDITKQEVLIAVGRGIQNQDNLTLAEDLATALGGAVCASRPVIDQGWVPMTRQVGKSGMTVKPKVYLALGISGAPEHVEGMLGSQLTIAINTDARAPIFDVAQYGVCGDLLEVIPALTEKLQARKK